MKPSYAAAAAVMMPQSQTLYMAPTQYSYPTVSEYCLYLNFYVCSHL